MVTIENLTNNIKNFIYTQVDSISQSSPMMSFIKPLVNRALDKNINKIDKYLQLIANEEGKIDVESIITEMIESLMNTQPFVYNTSFIGDIKIGGGQIVFNIPMTNKNLVLNVSDLKTFKEMLTLKQ